MSFCKNVNLKIGDLIPKDFEDISKKLILQTKNKIDIDDNQLKLIIPNINNIFKLDKDSGLEEIARGKGMTCGNVINAVNNTKGLKGGKVPKGRESEDLNKCEKNDLKCCMEKCHAYIKKTENFSDEYSMRIGAACINSIKALYLIAKQKHQNLVRNTSVAKIKFDREFKNFNDGLELSDLEIGGMTNSKFTFGPNSNDLNKLVTGLKKEDSNEFGNLKDDLSKILLFGENNEETLEDRAKAWSKDLNIIKEKFAIAKEKLNSGNFSSQDVTNYNDLLNESEALKKIKGKIDEYTESARKIYEKLDDKMKKKKKLKKGLLGKAHWYLKKLIKGSLEKTSNEIEKFSNALENKSKITSVNSNEFNVENQRKSVKNTCDEVKLPPNDEIAHKND